MLVNNLAVLASLSVASDQRSSELLAFFSRSHRADQTLSLCVCSQSGGCFCCRSKLGKLVVLSGRVSIAKWPISSRQPAAPSFLNAIASSKQWQRYAKFRCKTILSPNYFQLISNCFERRTDVPAYRLTISVSALSSTHQNPYYKYYIIIII